MPDIEYDFRGLEPGDRVTGLSLGNAEFAPLKAFIQRHAKSYQAQSFARTYGFYADADKLVAYITLICGEVITESPHDVLPPEVVFSYKSFPAVKIARLAVDQRHRGLGLGQKLVEFSVGVVREAISPMIGCRFIVVDSKKSAVDFYSKLGFTFIDTGANRALTEPVMFLDLLKA